MPLITLAVTAPTAPPTIVPTTVPEKNPIAKPLTIETVDPPAAAAAVNPKVPSIMHPKVPPATAPLIAPASPAALTVFFFRFLPSWHPTPIPTVAAAAAGGKSRYPRPKARLFVSDDTGYNVIKALLAAARENAAPATLPCDDREKD